MLYEIFWAIEFALKLCQIEERKQEWKTTRVVYSLQVYSYQMAKRLNFSTITLVENEHFNNIAVSLEQSTVHVPTNVYEAC